MKMVRLNGINRVVPTKNVYGWDSYLPRKTNYMKQENKVLFRKLFKRITGIEAIEDALYRRAIQCAVPKYKEGDWVVMGGFGRDEKHTVTGRVSFIEVNRAFYYSAQIEYFIVTKDYQIYIGDEGYIKGIAVNN